MTTERTIAQRLASAVAALLALCLVLLTAGDPSLRLPANSPSPAATADLADASHRLATLPVLEPVLRPVPPGEVTERSSRLAAKRDSRGGEKAPAALLPAVVAALPPFDGRGFADDRRSGSMPYAVARHTHRPRDPPSMA